MEDPQDDSLLCERCRHLDSRLLLSSTPSNPWRPWQVADVVDSATTTGCAFCCLLVSTLELVDVDEQTRNGTLYDKALFKVQNMGSKSNTVARFLAPKIEGVRRERGGWITFYVPKYCDSVERIHITVTDSKSGDGQWTVPFILAPGPGMPQSPSISDSELPPLYPRGTLFRNRSQSLTSLSTAIQSWRQQCHDTHECWKPLFQRRNPKAEYVKTLRGEIVRRDWYSQGEYGAIVYSWEYQQQPVELEQGRLDSVAMPSRCLEIVQDDSDDQQCWFWLRETAGEMGRYVILSHRWAPHTERVRTLKNNYRARVDGGSDNAPPIAPGDVTNVFQEAAQLTARLGVKYIWIDSLCIVQDDVEDWKREAGKMASYYQSAWLTLAADSTESLYPPADPEVLPPVVQIPFTDETGHHAAGLSIQRRINQHLPDLYTKAITDSELLSRGWVFQEWLLSPRIAAFSQNAGVFLVCSESLPQSALLDTVVRSQGRRQDAADKSYKNHLDLSLTQYSEIARSWRRVVEAYSCLNLTQVANDRLIALAGVASEFGAALRSSGSARSAKYMCGMWIGEITRDLQWERADRSGRPFARVPGFPSWSWASQGRIKADEEGTNARNIEAAGVRWNTPWSNYAEILLEVEVVGSVSGAADQADGHPRLEERGPLAISAPLPLSDDYGIENRFLALRIKGRLARDFYFKQEWPDGQRELNFAAQCTATWLVNPDYFRLHDKHDKRREEVYTDKAWHQVINVSGRDRVGWVSFDNPNLRVENTDSGPCIGGDRRRAIYALQLSRMKNVPVYVGEPTLETIYGVLFVAKCEAQIGDDFCFERVGVGRMVVNRYVHSIFDLFKFSSPKYKERTFWLV